MHLRMFYRKMVPYGDNYPLLCKIFLDSLTGPAATWYAKFEGNGQLFPRILQVQHRDSSRPHRSSVDIKEEWGIFPRVCANVA